MKRINKVIILNLLAALIFAQPAAQGLSLNQISLAFKNSAELIKPYITTKNCIKGTGLGAAVAYVVFSWNCCLESGFEFGLPKPDKVHRTSKNHIKLVINRIYNNRSSIKQFQAANIEQIEDCRSLANNNYRLWNALGHFKAEFKQYCESADEHAEIRMKNCYDAINKFLK